MHILLFDIDGTLINTDGAGRQALNEAMQEAFGTVSDQQVPISGRTDRGIARDMFQLHGVEETARHWELFREAYLRGLRRNLQPNRGRILPGVRELLEHVAARQDVLLGLLTGNVAEGARIKLEHFGLWEHFPHRENLAGFGDSHYDRNAVAAEAFARARHKAPGVDASRVWVIGDTPLDVACARAIGARAAAVATGLHGAEELAATSPDILFGDLSDFVDVAIRLLGENGNA